MRAFLGWALESNQFNYYDKLSPLLFVATCRLDQLVASCRLLIPMATCRLWQIVAYGKLSLYGAFASPACRNFSGLTISNFSWNVLVFNFPNSNIKGLAWMLPLQFQELKFQQHQVLVHELNVPPGRFLR